MKRIYILFKYCTFIHGCGSAKIILRCCLIYEVNAINQLIDFTNKAYAGPKVINWQWDLAMELHQIS
jgi:hypothetical protein